MCIRDRLGVFGDVVQQTLDQIRELSSGRLDDDQLILFHSRFVFDDRQEKEREVIRLFGPKGDRNKGHILVSTQVFECSLDADVDWMISQLCPVDLLFQRWGRLHRHEQPRPEGFEHPLSTVLTPQKESYELHGLIYGDSRILWRTQQLLQKSGGFVKFPDAYRDWIEPVYQEKEWGNEPDWIDDSHQEFINTQLKQRNIAKQLIAMKTSDLQDTDNNVLALTRDGDMNLSVTPVITGTDGKPRLLDGSSIESLDNSDRFEKLNLNSVGVPRTWNYYSRSGRCKNQLPEMDSNGLIWLNMQMSESGYQCKWGDFQYYYDSEIGFHRMKA